MQGTVSLSEGILGRLDERCAQITALCLKQLLDCNFLGWCFLGDGDNPTTVCP
jgi:hypothetical protein